MYSFGSQSIVKSVSISKQMDEQDCGLYAIAVATAWLMVRILLLFSSGKQQCSPIWLNVFVQRS